MVFRYYLRMAAKNISVQEAANRLGITRQRVVQLIGDGKGPLKADKVGRAWVLRESVVAAFKEAKLTAARKAGVLRFDYELDVEVVEDFLAACAATGEDVKVAAARALANESKRMNAK